MKSKRVGLLSVSLSVVAALFAGTYFANKDELPYADPVSVTDEKIDVTNLKTYFEYNPQDEHYSSQGIALDHVGDIKKVWDKTKGEGTTIAIIDSGIDWTHPDFYDEDGNSKLRMSDARYYAHVKGSSSNWRYPTSGETIYSSDLKYFDTAHSYTIEGKTYSGNDVIRHNGDTSHGTNTASTAASYAHGNTDVGVIGIAPMAKILPIKVDMYMDSIGEAFKYIHELNTDSDSTNNVDVVNISICGASTWSTITSGAKALVGDGTIIVASAGNDNVSTIQYPAGDPNIIGVGALEKDSSTVKASFSNFNPIGTTSSTSNLNVEVTAPGHVYVADYTTYSTYKKTQGTSFSSPIVAGAAALWKSVNKSGTVSQFKTALHNCCVDIGSTGWDTTFGYGRLDVGNLIGTNDIIDISSVDLPAIATVGENKTLQLSKTVAPSNATSKDFRWWSMNERVATVDHNGVVTGHSSGTATIYCKSLANDNIKDTCTVTVVGDIIGVTGMTLTSNNELDLKVNETSQIRYVLTPSNATNQNVTFELEENNGVISISSTGLITALKEGEEMITITSVDNPSLYEVIFVTVAGTLAPAGPTTDISNGDYYIGATTGGMKYYLSCDATTNGKGTAVSSKENATVFTFSGSGTSWTIQFKSSKKYLTLGSGKSNGNVVVSDTAVTWTSSVDNNLLKLTPNGTYYLQKNNDGNQFGSYGNTQTNVWLESAGTSSGGETGEDTPPTPVATFESLSSTGTYTKDYTEGESFNHSKLTIYANYSDGTYKDVTNDVTWSPSTLSTTTTKVTASYTEDGVTKSLEFTGITVHIATVKVTGISLNKTTLSLEVGDSETLTATITPNNATNKGVVWSSSDNEVATVGNGIIEAISKGTATIYARSNEDDTIKATCSVTVTEKQSSGYTGTYYNSITATSGTNLLGQLHTLMANTHSTYTTYDDCKNSTYIYKTDPGTSSDYVTDFYTQKDNQVAWGSGATGTWNREHVWCQSLSVSASTGTQLWGETYGGSDLQHVRPVESTLNSKRNNNPYGVLSDFGYNRNEKLAYAKNKSGVQTDLGGYVVSGSGSFEGVFEPLDTAKGDVARILMYVYMHYSNQTSGTDSNTKLTGHTTDLSIKKIVNTSANTDKAAWDLLLLWNESDPVSEMEQIRNEEAFNIQGNRNPFIDHPEYAEAIWGSSTPTPTKTLSSISISNEKTEYSVGDTFEKPTVTANYSDGSDADVTNNATFSEYDLSTTGTQTVSVSYTEGGVTKTASYTITVTSAVPQSKTLTFALNTNPGGWPTTNSTTLTNYTYTLDSVDYSFGLKNVKSNSGYLMMTQPAVLGLPAIEGYKLTKVVASNSGGCSTSVYVGISSSSSSESYIAGGSNVMWSTTSSSYTYNLTETAANTVYYLYVTSKNAQVTSLELTYDPAEGGSVTPTPTPEVNSITLDKSTLALDLNGNKTATIVATVDADEGADRTVSWSSSNESVATVSNGTITAVGVGTATITAQAGEKTATCTVNVSDSSPVITGITLSNTSLTLNVGDDETLTATINGTNIPSDAKVSWSSDETNIATVDQNGKVTGVSAGTAVITASYGGKDASCTVTVKAAEPGPGPTPTGEYILLTDASVLKAGYQIVIANSTNKVTAGQIPDSKAYMDQVTSAFSSDGNKITTLGEGTVEFTLSGDASGWTLSNESNVLGSGGAKSVSWNTGTTTWTISVDSNTNNVTIANTTSTNGKILYNLGSTRFSSYASSPNNQMLMPQIYYKSSGSTPEPEKNIVSATLTPNVSTVKYMENNGSLDVSATLVVKYEDGETKTVEPTSKNYTIDTTSLGKQQISATYKGVTYYGYVSVSSQGYSAGSSSKDSFSVSDTNINSGAGYKSFEMTDKSNATYVGIACNTGALQIKSSDSNTGVVQTVSGGKVKSITFNFSNIGNGIQIYGKNTNYSEAANLFSDSLKGTLLATVTSSGITYASGASPAEFIEQGDTAASTIKTVDISSLGDYEYIGFRSISGAVALNSFEVNVESDGTSEYEALARAWSNYFMSTTSPICGANQSGDNSAELSAVWTDLTNEFNNMNSKAQSLFLTSNDEVIVAARERYTHIVSHYGTNLTANFAGAQIASRNAINLISDLQVFTSDHPESYITLILSLVGAFSLGGYFVVKKRKEN